MVLLAPGVPADAYRESMAVAHLRAHGAADAHLIADRTPFYEKCGRTSFGTVEKNDGKTIRMYPRSTAPRGRKIGPRAPTSVGARGHFRSPDHVCPDRTSTRL